MKEASFYERLDDKKVHCHLCRHNCLIADGQRGICSVRENSGGTLYSLVYGMPIAWHVDPIEKKPLFHFFPGSRAFSIATAGCNFQCLHCQNHEISQIPKDQKTIPGGRPMAPADVVAQAVADQCTSISHTYTEPTIFYEYAFDIAREASEKGIYNNFVTNGYIEEEPLKAIKPFLAAANIDLKGFSESFYRKVCKADLTKVLATIRAYKALDIWIELTTLIIPGYNDDPDELTAIARFIKTDLGAETPWHVSAFYPTYRLTDAPPTDPRTLVRAREIGVAEGLRYVYVGNIPGLDGEDTYCYQCKKSVIGRYGFSLTHNHVKDGRCEFCGALIDGIGLR